MNDSKISYHTNCGINMTQHWTDPTTIRLRDDVFRFYQGKMQIIVTIFGLFLTILYIAAIYKSICDHRVSRKFYALLMNRAIGDLTACIVSVMIVVYTLFATHINTHIMQLFSTLFIGCFWSAMVSYTALGFLKLYGIARPLHYRDRVTVRRTIHLIILSWAAFLLLVFMTLGVTAFSKIEALANWSGCKLETCVHDMYIIRNGATSLMYFSTIICFVITVVLIKKAQKFAKSLHRPSSSNNAGNKGSKKLKQRFRFPLIKLTLNVLTFAIFHFPYTIWVTFLVFTNGCFYLLHYNKMAIFMGFVRLSLLIRIMLDALISFATDRELRQALYAILNLSKPKIFPHKFCSTNRGSVSVGEISTDSGAVSTAATSRRKGYSNGNSAAAKVKAMRSNTVSTMAESSMEDIPPAGRVTKSYSTDEDNTVINATPGEVGYKSEDNLKIF